MVVFYQGLTVEPICKIYETKSPIPIYFSRNVGVMRISMTPGSCWGNEGEGVTVEVYTERDGDRQTLGEVLVTSSRPLHTLPLSSNLQRQETRCVCVCVCTLYYLVLLWVDEYNGGLLSY